MKSLFSQERRLCMVKYHEGKELKEKRAFFHLFTTNARPLEPSPLRGGHPGGQYSEPLAIVEYEDGTVDLVSPLRVRFLDTEGQMAQYAWGEEAERVRSCLTCEYNMNGINRPCDECKGFDKWEAEHSEWEVE